MVAETSKIEAGDFVGRAPSVLSLSLQSGQTQVAVLDREIAGRVILSPSA
ncbi:MAG: hypothetical protein KY449_11955 [Proteobacteria bacterium]|nr:hypothetical protein [Pseudomonadota bacterium]